MLAELTDLAEAHGVLPLVAHNLPGPDNPPPEPLGRRLLAATALAMAVRAEEQKVLAALSDHGIDGVVVKGSSFADRLYPPGLRVFRDSDILIARDAMDEAGHIMSSMGYRSLGRQGKHADAYGQSAWRREGGSALIELHWNLVNSPALRRRLSLTRDALAFGDDGLPTPASLLLIAAVHGATSHSFARLGLLVDIAQCCRGAAGDIDEPSLRDAIDACSAQRPMAWGVWAANRWLAEPACDRVRQRLGLARPHLGARLLLGGSTVLRPDTRRGRIGRNLLREGLKRS
jgi:hypothetical protein